MSSIAIVGSGPVGLLVAVSLAKRGIAVDVFGYSIDYTDARTMALSHFTCDVLKNNSCDHIFDEANYITKLSLSGVDTIYATDFDLPFLGCSVKYSSLCYSLLQQVPNINICHINEVKYFSNCVQISTDESVYSYDIVIMADGGNLPIAGVKYKSHTYDKTIYINNISVSNYNHNTAFHMFEDYGTLALVPYNGEYVSILTLDNDFINNNISNYIVFNKSLINKLGKITVNGDTKQLYQSFCIANDAVIANRILLLGNSLHTFLPFAAQGFNLAVKESVQLVRVLAYGNPLSDYSSSIKKFNSPYFVHLAMSYQNSHIFKNLLFLFNKFSWLRNRIIQYLL